MVAAGFHAYLTSTNTNVTHLMNNDLPYFDKAQSPAVTQGNYLEW